MESQDTTKMEMPDLRKIAKESGMVSDIPEAFLCDSRSCRKEQDTIWALSGFPTSTDRINDLIKKRVDSVYAKKQRIKELEKELEMETVVTEDLLTALGYDEITWKEGDGSKYSKGDHLYAVRYNEDGERYSGHYWGGKYEGHAYTLGRNYN